MQYKLTDFRGVLFDFDGVIARTMEDNFEAWQYAFRKFDIDIDKDSYFLLEGLKPLDVAKNFMKLKQLHDVSLAQEIVAYKESYYLKNNNFSLYDGVFELLNYLVAKGKKIAVVTGASQERLFNTLRKNSEDEIIALFNVIITAADYSFGKPSPEPYQMALRQLLLDHDECIVVENAPLGIESALNAGLQCIALTTTLNKYDLRQANFHFTSIKALYDYQILGDKEQ